MGYVSGAVCILAHDCGTLFLRRICVGGVRMPRSAVRRLLLYGTFPIWLFIAVVCAESIFAVDVHGGHSPCFEGLCQTMAILGTTRCEECPSLLVCRPRSAFRYPCHRKGEVRSLLWCILDLSLEGQFAIEYEPQVFGFVGWFDSCIPDVDAGSCVSFPIPCKVDYNVLVRLKPCPMSFSPYLCLHQHSSQLLYILFVTRTL